MHRATGGAIALILGLFLSGCAATSALDDRQLGKLLEAYRTESRAAEARQPQGASRGIRRLEVEGTGPGRTSVKVALQHLDTKTAMELLN